MRINTTRFGEVEVKDEDRVEFAEGLLGFGHLNQFVLLDDPHDDIFAWLQSCENPEVAFPILEPELYAPQYKVELTKVDTEALKIESQKGVRFFTIVTIPQDPTQMTANLKAPIVINVKARLARQCVLQDNNLAIREPIFTKLQQRIVQNPGASFKPEAEEIGAILVNRPGPDISL